MVSNHTTVRISNSSLTCNHCKIIGNNNRIVGNHNKVTGDFNNIVGNHNKIVGKENKSIGNHNSYKVGKKKSKKSKKQIVHSIHPPTPPIKPMSRTLTSGTSPLYVFKLIFVQPINHVYMFLLGLIKSVDKKLIEYKNKPKTYKTETELSVDEQKELNDYMEMKEDY